MFIFFIFCHFFVQFCGLIIDDEKKRGPRITRINTNNKRRRGDFNCQLLIVNGEAREPLFFPASYLPIFSTSLSFKGGIIFMVSILKKSFKAS